MSARELLDDAARNGPRQFRRGNLWGNPLSIGAHIGCSETAPSFNYYSTAPVLPPANCLDHFLLCSRPLTRKYEDGRSGADTIKQHTFIFEMRMTEISGACLKRACTTTYCFSLFRIRVLPGMEIEDLL